jgi:uncharacterized glyoxalase superfamily protein PhnB
MQSTAVQKITAVLAVENVQPSLDFWTQRLGFECTVTVPHEDTTGFAILVKDGTELMLQSVASILADLGANTGEVNGRSAALFIEVADLGAIENAIDGYPIEMPRRTNRCPRTRRALHRVRATRVAAQSGSSATAAVASRIYDSTARSSSATLTCSSSV